MKKNKFSANKHRGRHVSRFASKKNGCGNKVEAFLELTYACIFECNPDIVNFASQPESLHLTIDNKDSRYTPDFLVLYSNGSAEYIEVHHSESINEHFNRRIELFSEYSQQITGIPIKVVTEKGLCPLSRVNYQLIADCKSNVVTYPFDVNELLTATTFDALITALEKHCPNAIAMGYQLLADGIYTFEMSELLQNDTELAKVELC
jgi:hypothetical protein